MAMTKRKVTLKLIENDSSRKACFKKRQGGLLQKLEELTILCGIDACAIIQGEDDAETTVWPSPTVAKDLILRFQNVSEFQRRRNMVTQLAYMQERTKRIQNQVLKHRKRNNERDMSIFMHEIYDDGKPLCDFEVSVLRRLICYVEKKLKDARKRICHFEFERLLAPKPPPPPSSCPLENGVLDDMNFWINIHEQVSEQPWFLDLLEDANQMNRGNDYNTRSNMGLPALHVGDIDMVLPQGNFRGLNGESGSGVLLPGNFRGLINGETDLGVLPQGNFRGLNGDTASGLLHGNSGGEIGGSDIQLPYGNFGSTIGGSDVRLPYSSYEGNINGNNMGIGPIINIAENNMGLWCHQRNFRGNNSGVAMGGFVANFLGTNNGGNLYTGLPTLGNFASRCEGSDFGVPISYEGNFAGSDMGATKL